MWNIYLYANDVSPPCRTVLMVAREIELKLQIREVNLAKQEHLTEEFLKMNPLHTIPVFEDCGYVLSDSHAIACYLIDEYAKYDTLYPRDLQKRALINQCLMFEVGTMFPPLKRAMQPILMGQESSISEEKMNACKEAYWYLNKMLEGKVWLVGKSYTVADISCVTLASSASIFMDMDLFPNVKAWIKRCEQEIPSYSECNVPGLTKLHTLLVSALSSS